MISFVVPVLNEAAVIGPCLDRLAQLCPPHETIVCDGGSTDGTLAELQRRPWVRLLAAPRPCRALQMNLAAAEARFDVLVFLHADLSLPTSATKQIEDALSHPAVVGGGFRKSYRDASALLRLMEWGLNSGRTSLAHDFLGTNVIFCRAGVFRRLGGYRDWPLLEDVDFSDRLKRAGTLAVLEGPVEVPSRKYQAEGTLFRLGVNARILFGYRLLGEQPDRLASQYRFADTLPTRPPVRRLPELVSIVIPTLDEEEALPACLSTIAGQPHTEIVIADGGSRDGTEAVCRRFPGVRFVPARGRGRALQMNVGAANTSGEILLFLHADTLLPAGALERVREAMSGGRVAAGAFDITFDSPGWMYRLLARLSNVRNRLLKTPYGDQALFLRRETFRALGGFPEVPFLEDLEMARRLRAAGAIRFLSRPGVRTSARRFKAVGPFRAGLRNAAILLLYLAGIPPARLQTFYGGGDAGSREEASTQRR